MPSHLPTKASCVRMLERKDGPSGRSRAMLDAPCRPQDPTVATVRQNSQTP